MTNPANSYIGTFFVGYNNKKKYILTLLFILSYQKNTNGNTYNQTSKRN